MQITETIKDFDFTGINERVEQFGRSAVDSYTETSDRVIDVVVDANKKVVDVVVDNVTKVSDAVDARFAETSFVDRLPSAEDAGKAYMDAVERAADFNRDLNRRVVDLLPVSA